MKSKLFAAKIIFSLLIFSPLALIPSVGRPAILSSQTSGLGGGQPAVTSLLANGVDRRTAGRVLAGLSPRERELLGEGQIPLGWGGQAKSDINQSLSTNHAVAIILTLIMLGCVLAFVEQSRD